MNNHASTEVQEATAGSRPDFDQHLLIVTAEEVLSPSGRSRGWQVRAPEHLAAVLTRWRPRSLVVDEKRTNPPTCYLVGADLLEQLGLVAAGDTVEEVKSDLRVRLEEFAAAMPDWRLRWKPSGGWCYLEHTQNNQAVDIVLEPYYHLTAGVNDMGLVGDGDRFDLPEDDAAAARELARRVAAVIELLGVMPKASASATGAELAARFNRARREPIGPTFLPNLEGTASSEDLPERPLNWTADRIDDDQLAAASRLIVIDQRNAYLAAAQTDLGWGEPRHVDRGEAAALIAGKKIPQGWWHIDIDRYSAEFDLTLFPAPSPVRTKLIDNTHREPQSSTHTWVTTTTLKYLMLAQDKGGAGLIPRPQQAWIFPHSGRPLTDWVNTLKVALLASTSDEFVATEQWAQAMSGYYFKTVYKAYIGRMSAARTWNSEAQQQHIQPYWEQSIIANCRGRSLLFAAKTRAEHGLTPLACATDAWTYLVPDDVDLVDDGGAGYLGKYKTDLDLPLTAADKKILRSASGPTAVAEALAKVKTRTRRR